MSPITYAFPIITILFIGLFYLGLPSLKSVSLGADKKAFTKKDALCLALIVIIYALFAFYKLGDTRAATSHYVFQPNESVYLDLGEKKTVSKLSFYSGLNTGSYDISYSKDGLLYYHAGKLEQDYIAMYKWTDAELDDGADPETRYIKITASGNLYLNELAVRDSSGTPLQYYTEARELNDEQELVPDWQYYLNSTYFDEIYHARTAYEHIENVQPYEVSHPPLGKLIIAIGIELFGMTPFGWRFSGTLFGVLMLPVLYLLLKKMFGSTVVSACGTALFAFDFMHFAQTRIATIDTYAVFFILLMYMFMYLYISEDKPKHLALSGVFFGVGIACKWTCFYAGAGLAVIWLLHWIGKLRRGEKFAAFIKNCLFCLLFFVLIPAVIYYLSYFRYGTANGLHGAGMLFTKEYADIVLDNQKFMFTYHSGVHAEHPYSSRWYQWIFNIRPILYYLQSFSDGSRSSFGAFANPVVCWAGLAAIFANAYLALFRRDKTSAFIVIGYLAQLLPWVFISRTTFEYHYFPSIVFLVLALARVFALMKNGTKYWKGNVYGLTGLAIILFIVFYPAISGKTVDSDLATRLLRWLPSWPF